MSPTIEEQIAALKRTISEMEAQRETFGDEVVDAGLVPFLRKLDQLEALLQTQKAYSQIEPTKQRKLITLLFMDIVGSTSIAQHMDPEDVSDVFDVTLKKLAQPVKDYGGRVTRFMGDGFLAVFGVPIAHEDDPERAIRAGLMIIDTAQEMAPKLEAEWCIPTFQVRVGINTGLVLLGGETEAEDTLMGASVNLASRLENAAPPGGLLISHDTYRHVRGMFDVEPWEPLEIKGFDKAIKVYLVLRAKERSFRTYTRGVEGVETRMVGREYELKYLQDALLNAIAEGEGQVVTVSGEAGVGKSRLLYEFQNWIELQPPPTVHRLEGCGRHETQGLPCGLLRDLFEFRFQIQDDDSGNIVRKKFTNGLMDIVGSDQDGEQCAHILGQWLGFDFSTSPHLRGMLVDPEQLHNQGLMYLEEYFNCLSAQYPVVIFLEDIHWADDTSLDAINWLGERLQFRCVLIVCAARHSLFERRPFWGEGLSYHHNLELKPLSKTKCRQLVAEILRFVDQVPSELRELVVKGAEGNPFYVEELIKMLVENGVIVKSEEFWQVHLKLLSDIDVPPTLGGVLQARLDSLPYEEKTVLQQASVVGHQFWDQLVAHMQAAVGDRPEVVPDVLTALRGRELIYRRERSSFAEACEYVFKHEMLREVTYESVTKRLRRVYHGFIAEWLIVNCSNRVNEYYGLIAEHLLLAEKTDQAREYFTQAGKTALASFSNAEAEGYFRRALQLSPSSTQQADLICGLAEALQLQGRSRFDEAHQIWLQAIQLFQDLGESDRLAFAYTHLSTLLWDLDHQVAWNLCEEALHTLEGAPDSSGYAHLLAEAARTAFFRNISDQVLPLCHKAREIAARIDEAEVALEVNITSALNTGAPESGIEQLHKVIYPAEKLGLLRTAARAHLDLGYFYGPYLINIVSARRHYLRAAEIYRQIGDIERMLYALTEVYRHHVFLGQLDDANERVIKFIRESSAPKQEVNKFFQEVFILDHAKGEWKPALENRRVFLEKLHQGGSIYRIAWHNLWLVETILELNHFGYLDDLSEAIAALMENIEFNWLVTRSQFMLAVTAARQNHISEAREYFDRAKSNLSTYENNIEKASRIHAEFELARGEKHWSKAVEACISLIEIYQNCQHHWAHARWLIDLGDALQSQDSPGDRKRAENVYRQSLEMFAKMGAPGYIHLLERRLGEKHG